MSQKAIRAALEGLVRDWAAARVPALPVAWQNVGFKPPQDGIYLRCFVIPAETISEDLRGLHRLFRGIFQVSIVVPTNTGTGLAGGIAEELDALIPMNLRLPVGGLVLQITSPMSAAEPLQEPGSCVIPVSASYRCDLI